MIVTHQTIVIFGALLAILIGLLVAEFYWHKAVKHSNHVVPAAIIKNSQHVVWQKFFYYGLFLTFLFADHVLNIRIPEACYYLDVFAIAGGDIQKLANRFFRLK